VNIFLQLVDVDVGRNDNSEWCSVAMDKAPEFERVIIDIHVVIDIHVCYRHSCYRRHGCPKALVGVAIVIRARQCAMCGSTVLLFCFQCKLATLIVIVKDLICAPPPFAPPVTRLSKYNPHSLSCRADSAIGTHHLEYGFHLRIRRIAFRSRCSSSRVCTCSTLLQEPESITLSKYFYITFLVYCTYNFGCQTLLETGQM
jgi:hypothetical protein